MCSGRCKVLVPMIYVVHVVCLVFVTSMARADQIGNVQLPTRFRAVLYLDVFGWLACTEGARQEEGSEDEEGDDPQHVELPRDLQVQLAATCQRLLREATLEVTAWEMPGVDELLEDEPNHMERVCEFRHRADFISAQLKDALPPEEPKPQLERIMSASFSARFSRSSSVGGSTTPQRRGTASSCGAGSPRNFGGASPVMSPRGSPAASPPMSPPAEPEELEDHIWLELKWNEGDPGQDKPPLKYYFQPGTEQASWDFPEHGRVSNFESLDEKLATLAENVRMLLDEQKASTIGQMSHIRECSQYSPEASFSGEQPSPVTRSLVGVAEGAYAAEDGPAEGPFGGREAVNPVEAGEAFGDTAMAQATFGASAQSDAAAARTLRRVAAARTPPGRIPWRTFLHGSTVLICIWIAGAVWVSLLCLGGVNVMPYVPGKNTTATVQEAESTSLSRDARHNESGVSLLQLVQMGPWPRHFVRPTSLVCHAELGDSMLLVERYAVHELSLASSGGRTKWKSALQDCVANYSGFQSKGFAGLTVQCAAGASCTAWLLGASGRRALRCDLRGREAPHEIVLHGGPWRSLVASSSSLWAVGSSSVARLGHVSEFAGAGSALVPEQELPGEDLESLTQLHAEGEVLLGLDANGFIRSWSLARGRHNAWSLTGAPAGALWAPAICSVNGAAYLLKVGPDGFAESIWRAVFSPAQPWS